MRDKLKRKAMGKEVRHLSSLAQVLCFQEVHGYPADILHQFRRWLPNWCIYVSGFEDGEGNPFPNAGGIVTALCPVLCEMAICQSQIIIPGRCSCVSILAGGKVLSVLNVHNFGLSFRQAKIIRDFVNELSVNVNASPTTSLGLLVGDINIKAEHERSFKISAGILRGVADRGYSNPLFSGHRLGLWKGILAKATEIAQPMPTHFDFASKSCSRIDRCWAFGPSNLLIKLQVRSHVVGTPEEYYGNGLSDHAPVVVSLGHVDHVHKCEYSVPKFVCKHPSCGSYVEAFASYVDLLELPNHVQMNVFNDCIKEASKKVLDEIHHCEGESLQSQRMIFASISRAVWYGNYALAKKLISSSVLAQTHIELQGCKVVFKDPPAFSVAFDEIHSKFYKDQIEEQKAVRTQPGISGNALKQAKSRIQCFRRLEAIYWPKGKRMNVTGVTIFSAEGTASVVHTPSNIQKALTNYWAPVYSVKPGDEAKAKVLLDRYHRKYSHSFTFADIPPPDPETFENCVKHAKDSACGFNGVGYSAYKAVVSLSGQVLSNTFKDLCLACPLTNLEKFNIQKCWFAPKGVVAEDKTACIRTPDKFRTIFGSNCDSKLVSGTIAFMFGAAVLLLTPMNQRGFCKGRQLSLNSVDLDVFMRFFNAKFDLKEISAGRIGGIPVTVLYDFCNAFPTILHSFLFLVLECLGVPEFYRNAIFNLYTSISAYSSGIGDGSFLFNVLCGVKTGCPLSSLLFLLCVNPFIELFKDISDNPGFSITRVCADDFGSALECLERIRSQASIFKLAAAVAGLHLKPVKCVIIISCIELSDELVFAVKQWLAINVPDFKDFLIASSGKYLGWFLGVDAASISWQEPRLKFVDRVEGIVGAQAPATTSLLRYNQRAVPVLSFVSQFSHPPPEVGIAALDQWSVHKLLRMPANSFSRKLCHSVSFCTEVDPVPLNAYCAANMIRFAHSEREYLINLCGFVNALCINGDLSEPHQDPLNLCSVNSPLSPVNMFDIPSGGIKSTPLIVNLLHAIHLSGPFKPFRDKCLVDPNRKWLAEYPAASFPTNYKSLQGAALNALSKEVVVSDMYSELHKKLKVTLQPIAPVHIPINWFGDVQKCLSDTTPYIKLCWLKTVGGAWCTSVRLSSYENRPCIFGCTDCRDELCHYLQCPLLWQLASGACDSTELDPSLLHRICLYEPSNEKLRKLAFCHALYHACVNDTGCIKENGMPLSSEIVLARAAEASNYCIHLVGGM